MYMYMLYMDMCMYTCLATRTDVFFALHFRITADCQFPYTFHSRKELNKLRLVALQVMRSNSNPDTEVYRVKNYIPRPDF